MNHSRQLAAIMFTDIKGYTHMMEVNEVEANLFREKMIKSVTEEVATHNGRVVKFEGDGSLCIFNSSINAVRAAIAIQCHMNKDPKVPLRIGIHTGDIVIEENSVYGDSVNVASRVESFSIPGGVLISGKVNDDIKNQPDIFRKSVGRFEFKNIKEPVELFIISNPGLVVPQKIRLEGKGIAVADKSFFFKKEYSFAGGRHNSSNNSTIGLF